MAGALVTTNILQTLVTMGLQALRERVVMPRIVNREYENKIVGADRGSTVNVAVPSAIATRTVAPDVVPPSVPAVTPTKVAVTLTEWKEAPFAMDDKGLAQVSEGLVPMQASEAIKSLANTIDNFLWGKYKAFYGYAGTAATTPFASDLSAYLTARKFANTQLMDMDPRFMLIDAAADANAMGLRAMQDASFRGDKDGIINGQIGRKIGATWLMTQNVPTHTTTAAGTIIVNDASHATGAKTITWDGGGTAPAEGDVFTAAGDTQTYVVVSSTSTVITHEPAGAVALADNAALTFKADHVVNLLLHRDAIAFAMAPLQSTKLTAGENSAVAIDEESGLSLRLELTRQHKQYQWSWDALYGASVVRPEFGVRLAG
jgi:hypothetical protein